METTLHIYIRVSSLVQEEEGSSLQTQKELGIKKADELGFKSKVWNEGGKSSKYEDLENRPILKRLLVEMEEGGVEHLFVFNTDRLSRNQKTWGGIRWKLKEHGVKLYTPSGVIDLSSPMDDLMFGILSEISQYDNSLRTERSRLGKLNRVRQGFWMGGPPPFGYEIKDRKLVENSKESQWVKKIYKWSSKNKHVHWIKDELDKNGVRTRHGKGLWSIGSIQKLLRNTHYIGHYTYNDKKLNETVECLCPSVIDDRLWNSVQERREKTKERKGQNNRTKRFYLLRNMMFCGHCERPMSGRIKPSKNERLYYCPDKERNWKKSPPNKDEKWVRGRGCDMIRSLNIPRTDELVWKSVMDVLSNSEVIKNLVGEALVGKEGYEKNVREEKKQEKRLSKELLKIEEMLSRIETDHLLEKMDKKLYRQVRKNLDGDKQKTREKLDQTRLRMKEMRNHDKWMDSISRFQTHLEKAEKKSDEEKKEYLEVFVDRIDVGFDHKTNEHELTIKFKLPIVGDEYSGDGKISMGRMVREVRLPPNKTTLQ